MGTKRAAREIEKAMATFEGKGFTEDEILKVLKDIKRLCYQNYDIDFVEDIYADAEYRFLLAVSEGKIKKEKGNLFSYANACRMSAASDFFTHTERKSSKETDINDINHFFCSTSRDIELNNYRNEIALEGLRSAIERVRNELYTELQESERVLDILLGKRTQKEKAQHLDYSFVRKYETVLYGIIAKKLSDYLGVFVDPEHIKQYFHDINRENRNLMY